MALSIVAESNSAPDAFGITKSSWRHCDVFSGSTEALIAAGLLSVEQLKPQKGRVVGHTAFLPSGEPCPHTQRAWREPGFKTVRQQGDGMCCVEVTVAKDVQLARLRARKAAALEAEQLQIDEKIVEDGYKYRNWTLKHGFSDRYEYWEGTKQQLQAVGLGMGMAFPGEGGAQDDLNCKCPLGFDVRIYLPTYDHAMAAARIYRAQSWYVQGIEEKKQYVQYAPGVRKEVWTCFWLDVYVGTAEALVVAGLVPDLRYFPGQPGANKIQASYQKNWGPATCASNRNGIVTIRKRGNSGQFVVQVSVTKEEEGRRRGLMEVRDDEKKRDEARLSAERRQLRQSADQSEQSAESFRAKRASSAEIYLRVLSNEVFDRVDGALRFDIPKDGELWSELVGAFQVIRDAVQNADICRDKKQEAAARARLKLVAARNDTGLQSLLHNAKLLRLVPPVSDEE